MEQRKGIILVTGGLPIALGASEQGTKSPESPVCMCSNITNSKDKLNTNYVSHDFTVPMAENDYTHLGPGFSH